MHRSRREITLWSLVLLALGTGMAFASGRVLDSMGIDRPYDVAYVPHGDALRLASPAIRLSVADYYWLETVQYIGEPLARKRGFEKLFPLADLVTDLDPRHGYAYQTAGIMLSAERRLDESDRILQKGMGPGRPNWWSFPFYVAYNHYFYRGDYAEAARWAKIAARTPGSSPNISHLAMALDVKSGSPDDAVRFMEELRAVAKDEKTAAALDEQYRLAVLQRDFARLDAAVERYRELRGRAPSRLEELVAAGALDRIPPEPFNGHYFIGDDGRVHSSRRDLRFKPPEPGRLRLAPPAAAPHPTVTKIAAIAAVTLRDALRQKLAVNLLIFALLVISASIVLSELTFGEQYRIISDLALSSAAIFGTLIAVFVGSGLVAGDIQRRTLYPIIAKPVSRSAYLLGRYSGLVATLTLNLLVMTVTTVLVIGFYRGGFGFLVTSPILPAFLALAAQLAMIGAVALLFSSFTSTTLASICTLAVAVAGHFSREAMPYWRQSAVGRVAALALPNLAALDYKVAVVYEEAIPRAELALRLGYAALYVGTALALAAAIFSRRDLR